MNVNNALRALLVLLIGVFGGLIAWNLKDSSAKEGGTAPGFSIHTDQNSEMTATSFGGKILVLNFWATWCQPCLQEIPSLNEFQKQFRGSGVVVLAVSVDKNAAKYKNFLDHVNVSFVTARDPTGDLSSEYGTYQYPESYIIKDGRVLKKFAEAKDWTSDDIGQYVKSLL